MQKYRTNLLLGLVFWIVCSQVVDAAPRNRRRSRRARANVTSRTYIPSNNIPTNNIAHQQQPIAIAAPQPIVAHGTNVGETPTNLPASNVTTAQAIAAVELIHSRASLSTTPRPLDVGDPLPLDPQQKTDNQVAPATYVASTPEPVVISSSAATTTSSSTRYVNETSSAIAEVNSLRVQRGLPPFVEDPSLSSVAYRKASIQANRGAMGHPGGSMGGARYEGVGMGHRFTSCFLFSNIGRFAGAATVRGRNGQRYHCLLIR